MGDTLAVLALDAADYRLARKWDCENILLDEAGRLETFTYSLDHPFTPEVWASVATGLHPNEHGVREDAADWNSLPLRLASKMTHFFPHKVRNQLGKPFRKRGLEQEIHRTSSSHAFEQGVAFGWPGIADAEHLSEAWKWASQINRDQLTEESLHQKTLGNTGKELGWLVGMETANVPIAGVHSHILDITGHTYATRQSKLREYYEFVDEMVGQLRREVSKLVILSDHGMQVSWIDDESPGSHSMRAMVSSTSNVDGSLPFSVFEVREWLEANTGMALEDDDTRATMDTAEGRLRELGYIE